MVSTALMDDYSSITEVLCATEYEYSKLRPREIRLAQFVPVKDEETPNVRLHVFDIDAVDDIYMALSYTWGGQQQNYVTHRRIGHYVSPGEDGGTCLLVVINDNKIKISQNLYDLLNAENQNWKKGFFWADQLCVNQADLEERKEQVALMGQIYAKASAVIVWLSKEIWDAPTAFMDNIKMAYDFCVSNLGRSLTERTEAESTVEPTVWKTLHDVFSQSYFQRVWIVQEITKAKLAHVMMGGAGISFDDLSNISSYLQSKVTTEGVYKSDFRNFTRPLQKIGTIRTRLSSTDVWPGSGRWTLLSLFLKMLSFQCTDPRDKVYAMASLLDNEMHCVPQKVVADYTIPYIDLVRETVSFAIIEQHDFTTLHYTHPGDYPHASWIPELDGTHTYTSEITFRLHSFSAALHQTPCVKRSGDGLLFRVIRIGHVTKMSDAPGQPRRDLILNLDFSFRVEVDIPDTLLSYGVLKDFLTAHPCEFVHTTEDLVRAWSLDHWTESLRYSTAGENERAQWTKIVDNREMQGKWLNRIEADGTSHDSFIKVLTSGSLLRSDCRACILDVDDNLSGLDGKRLFCWMPEGGQIGDEVVLVPGTEMPMLIRRTSDNQWAFQGVCYVHGIMDGQLSTPEHNYTDLEFV